jgi:DUF1365 family protein
MHRRVAPKRHRFRYRAYWLYLDLDELEALQRRLCWLSFGRFNLLSFDQRDYGQGGAPLRARIGAELARAGIDLAGGRIALLTMPRVLGYAFNPLSVFYCFSASGELQATIYEVHNTFGEQHRYVIAVAGGNRVARQHSDKQFHVSPFMEMGMRYAFRASTPGEAVSLGITASGPAGAMHAVLKARRLELTDRALAGLFFSHPLVTLKVIGAIHWEALRLWRKRLRIYAHPDSAGVRERT